MNMQEIRQLLQNREKVDLECKEAKNSVPKSVYESYSAFANTQGGDVILGIAEDRAQRNPEKRFLIQGVENAEKILEDKEFLENLGAYRKDRRKGVEGLTLAGLMMFGKGLAIRDEFDNIFMDYRDESGASQEIRWMDRVTYDGTWENNLFNFFTKVSPKLTSDLKRPFKLEGNVRIDDTPVHKAVREAFVNLIIHADYLMDAGVLKIIKKDEGFSFTNPGTLKLPKEQIYHGGDSKARNGRMQIMLRMVGFGDNAGSGFPAILAAWKNEGWEKPELIEDTQLNQVTLVLKLDKEPKKGAEKRSRKKEPKKGAEKKSQKKEPKKGAEKRSRKESETRKKMLLELLADNPGMTQTMLADKCNLTRKQVQTAIKELKEDHFLERTGANRNGYWVVKGRK